MTKKILISLSVIAVVVAIAIGATTAYFSDVEESTGNTLSAGTIDISVDDENPWTKTYSEKLADMKPSEWRDYYYQIHNEGTNPADIWKHLKVIETRTGILTEPECTEQDGTWNDETGECTFPTDAADNNAIDTVITYDLYVQTAWDECGNGIGYSVPGPGDTCAMYQTSHVHDLGKVITAPANLIIDYAPGYEDSCRDTLTVEVSKDGATWTVVEEKPTHSVWTEEGWQMYRQKIYDIPVDFQFVRMTIPTCYIDYSAVYALEPIIAEGDKVKVAEIDSCWIYLGRLEPSERMFVEQSYHLQEDVTNWAQGDEMEFDIELLAQQITAPEPTPICEWRE